MTEARVHVTDDVLVEKVAMAIADNPVNWQDYVPQARSAIAIAYPAGVAAGREEAARAKVTRELIDAGARMESTLHKINGHWWNKRIRPDARDLRIVLDFVAATAIRQMGEG